MIIKKEHPIFKGEVETIQGVSTVRCVFIMKKILSNFTIKIFLTIKKLKRNTNKGIKLFGFKTILNKVRGKYETKI